MTLGRGDHLPSAPGCSELELELELSTLGTWADGVNDCEYVRAHTWTRTGKLRLKAFHHRESLPKESLSQWERPP